jgi:hypothetical protein
MTGAMPLIEEFSDFDVLAVKGASSRYDRSIGTGFTLNLNLYHFLSLDFALREPSVFPRRLRHNDDLAGGKACELLGDTADQQSRQLPSSPLA